MAPTETSLRLGAAILSTRMLAIYALTLAIFGCAAILYHSPISTDGASDLNTRKIEMEVFKFLMSTVLVAGVVLLYGLHREKEKLRDQENAEDLVSRREAIERQTEVRAIQRQRLEGFLKDFVSDYNDIKYFRRELRHALRKVADDSYNADYDVYIGTMRELNKLQLNLEKYEKILKAKPEYLMEIATEGEHLIKISASYLREMLHEYEFRRLEHGDKSLRITPESLVYQFAAPSSWSRYDGGRDVKFFDPLDEFFKLLYRHMKTKT